MNEFFQTIAVYALPVIFAITLHEAAHAYVAKHFGDLTAYSQGRMTLNPVKHIDPVGTILLPVGLYLVSLLTGFGFVFGYAKPVPIEFGNLRNPKRDMAWVAFAGPAANIFMALMWLLLSIGLKVGQINEPFFSEVAIAGVYVNLLVFAFNLFPIPPLDGGRIVTSVLPHRLSYKYAQLEPYGFVIVIALAVFHVLWTMWMIPVMNFANGLLQLIVSPLTVLIK